MEHNPVSLIGIKSAFGEREIQNSEIEAKYGLPAGWVIEKTGKEKGHAWDNGPEAPIEASLRCFDSLLATHGLEKGDIKAVFGTTNPIVIDGVEREKSLTEEFAMRAELADREIRDVSFGCGGPAVGIEEMSKWFAHQESGTHAVYVTQDWSTEMVRDRNVEALFSDAVSVSLWTNGDSGIYEVGDVFAMKSTIADESLGIVGGFWEMDGRQVSEAASKVPALVAEKLGINFYDYDIVPHQPNAKLLETIERLYNIQLHKDVAREHGNPTCSGSFIALEKVIKDREKTNANDDKDILVMPFGAGGVGGFILKKKVV